jgi:hypothetical protein
MVGSYPGERVGQGVDVADIDEYPPERIPTWMVPIGLSGTWATNLHHGQTAVVYPL